MVSGEVSESAAVIWCSVMVDQKCRHVLNSKINKGKSPNSKHQIPNKSQITTINDQNRLNQEKVAFLFIFPCFGILNLGHCNLFEPALVRRAWVTLLTCSGLGVNAVNTSSGKSVWARDLSFGICDF
jgi:hypothetical protein